MTKEEELIAQAALAMSPESRAELMHRLDESLQHKSDDDWWGANGPELDRRVADLRSGKSKSIPWEDVRDWLDSAGKNGRLPD